MSVKPIKVVQHLDFSGLSGTYWLYGISNRVWARHLVKIASEQQAAAIILLGVLSKSEGDLLLNLGYNSILGNSRNSQKGKFALRSPLGFIEEEVALGAELPGLSFLLFTIAVRHKKLRQKGD